MKLSKAIFLLVIGCFCCIPFIGIGQAKLDKYSEKEIQAYKNRVEDQVLFFEYLLNTLGSSKTNQRDKEAIIKESYQKIFLSPEVQVEDDLTEGRKVVTNKDITAYLKDVDFFFENAQFNFEIQGVEAFEKAKGGIYFKVSLNRTLKATGLEGENILNTKKRYIEVNLDDALDELQIASIYTTKLSKDKAVKEWWSQLSYGWKEIFKNELKFEGDSVPLSVLIKMVAIDSLDLSNNNFIQNLDPLSMLSDLEYLNLEASSVKEINALSSLTNLKSLNLANTVIADLRYIQYAENISALNIANTFVTELSPIQNFDLLSSLNLQSSGVSSFDLIASFSELEDLNLSDSKITNPDLKVLSSLKKLRRLDLSKTSISTLEEVLPENLIELDITFTAISQLAPLASLKQLEVLKISNSPVRSLKALIELPKIQSIYADNTFISKDDLLDFKNARPKVLIIIDSEELTAWWAALDRMWKQKLEEYLPAKERANPSKEALSRLIGEDSLQLSGAGLQQLFPIKKFNRLRYLDLSNNQISSIGPLQDLTSINTLQLANNKISSIAPLSNLTRLKSLDLSGNEINEEELMVLVRLPLLKFLNLDGMNYSSELVEDLLGITPKACLIRYDDQNVLAWWQSLPNTWKQVFYVQQQMDPEPTIWQLTALLQKEGIAIADEALSDLNPLTQFVALKSLYIEKVKVNDLQAISSLEGLEQLHINKMPLQDISFLSNLKNLEGLNLDFTAVKNLEALEGLSQLKSLSLSGTAINSLKGVESLQQLGYLNIASTNVWWINKLYDLPALSTLICYNTKIWSSWIEKYQEHQPDCEIVWY